MFNVTLPWNHPSNNELNQAEPYEPLVCGFVNGHKTVFLKGGHYTSNVSPEGNFDNAFAREPCE